MQIEGYFILARLIFESAIWRDNPHVLKLFIYLIGNSRFHKKPKNFPGFKVKRGELVTSLRDIAEDNEYIEGGRVQRWSAARVSRMLLLLQDQKYITIIADTYGTHIRVCNYKQFQDPNYYKANTSETGANGGETGARREREHSNKDKKGKKEKKKTERPLFIRPDFIPEKEWNGYVEMRIKIKKPMTDYAKELKVSKLLKMKEAGEDIVEVLNKSTSNNWTDLWSLKDKESGASKKSVEDKASRLS